MEGDSSGPVATERVSAVVEPVLEQGSFALAVDSLAGPLGTRSSTQTDSSCGPLVAGDDSLRAGVSHNTLAITAPARNGETEPTRPEPKQAPRTQNSRRMFCLACTLLMAFFALIIFLAVTFNAELTYTTTGSAYGTDAPNNSNIIGSAKDPRFQGTNQLGLAKFWKRRGFLRQIGKGVWLWARSLNGLGSKEGEMDRCSIDPPRTVVVKRNRATELIHGRLFQTNGTERAGPMMGVTAEVGFGPMGSSPITTHTWIFYSAAFKTQLGDDDQYIGAIVAPPEPGTYALTFRFSHDGGASWTYCDGDGAGVLAGPASLMFNLTVV